MTDKVYIVTSGEYSAYHIEACFATREEAVEFCGKDWDGDEPYIAEWALGFPEGNRYQPTYYHFLVVETGAEHEQYPPRVNRESHPVGWSNTVTFNYGRVTMAYGVSTISKEHAMKLAVEARQAALRNAVLDPKAKD